MDTLMQAHIFFFISSIGFIVVGILFAVFLVYLIHFMQGITRIMEKVEKDVENISESTKNFLLDIEDSMLFRFIFGKKRRHKGVTGKKE